MRRPLGCALTLALALVLAWIAAYLAWNGVPQ